jgi:putative ABC transport system permease protein
MKLPKLVWKNMTRKKARAVLTLLSIIVAFTLYGMLASLAGVFSGEMRFSADDRLFVTSKHGGPLPVSYVERIKTIDGIVPERLVWGMTFAAYYQDEQETFGLQARDVDTGIASLKVGDRYIFDDAELESWRQNRTGILIQKRLADEYDLEVGDSLPLTTPGVLKEDGTNVWEFEVSGIYRFSDPDENPRQAIFSYDYFDENRAQNKGTVGYIVNIIDDPDDAERIGREIDAMFANSSYETQTGTEDSLTRDYFRRVGNMGFAIYLILGAVFLTMILVTANSMAQAFRERIHEIGVMKTLGFTGSTILSLILAESLLMLGIGGAIGLLCAYYIVELAKAEVTPLFYLSPQNIVIGLIIMVVTGVVVGSAPALQAKRLTIVQALGRT